MGGIHIYVSELNKGSNLGLGVQGTSLPAKKKEQKELSRSQGVCQMCWGSGQNSCPPGTSW